MARFTSWLLTLLLLGAFVAVAVHVLRARAEAGRDMPAYSVYSADRDGLRPAARFLRDLGWEPVALTRPVLHTHLRGLLVLDEPGLHAALPGEEPDLSEADVQGLLRWVAEGNTLLLCGRETTGLHRALGVTVISDRRRADEPPRKAEPGEAGRYTAGLKQIEVEGRDSLQADRGLPLWWLDDRPAAVLVRHGKGRVFVVADPAFLTARRLHQGADNAVFLYEVAAGHAADGRVYFDEYHHGLRSGEGFWGYLHHYGQQAVLLPLLVALAVAGWALAVRLGPAVPTPPQTRADAVDYASAVARIYQRTSARRLLGRGLARGFLATLTRHLRLRRSALPAEVLAAWRQRHPKDGGEKLEPLLRGLADLRKGTVSERQLLAWAQALDAFQSELTRPHRA